MGLNFRKSINIFPGVKLNLSKSGVGVSTGVKGARVSLNSKGQARTTLSVPGTGIYYTKQVSTKKIAKEMKEKVTGKGTKEAAKSTKAAAAKETIDVAANEAQVNEYLEYVEAIKSVHKDTDGYIDWERVNKGELQSEFKPYAEKVLAGDIDTYFEVIDAAKPFDDLLDFGSSFEVGTDNPEVMEVEFRVKSDEIVPTLEYSLKANGSISEKELSKTNYYALMQDYVASTTIRVARDTFALLPVKTCVVHAVDTILNTATGHEEEMTLLSVEFKRDQLLTLNMAMIDPSDAITGFKNNCKFVKTTGFKPVERIIPS